MDKGWSWVTMMAALGVHASCGGILYITGIIRVILLQSADPSEMRYITWITSMYAGILYLVGPIASVLVYNYGCRTSVILGAFLETFGLVLSFFAWEKWIYFITFSILSAFGSGISYAAVLMVLNYNFERYLSLAAGIAVSGQGSGLIFMPILANYLFNKYGMQGTFLLLGCVTLHKLVFGALMRPSSVELDQIFKYKKSRAVKNGQCPKNSSNSIEISKENSLDTAKENTPVEELSVVNVNGTKETCKENTQQNGELSSSILQENSSDISIHQKEDYYSDISLDEEEEESEEKNKQHSSVFTSGLDLEVEAKELFAYIISGEDNMAYNSDSTDNVNIETQTVEKTVNISRQTETNGLSFRTEEKNNTDSVNIVEHVSPKCRTAKDKMADLSPDISHETNGKNTDTEIKITNSSDKDEHSRTENGYSDKANSIDDKEYNPYLNVLKLRKFIFFLFSILFFTIAEEVIYMMFPSYSVEKGASLSEMSYLMSLLGIASCITRFLMGFAVNSSIADSYVLFSIPLGILGLLTLLLPLYAHTFGGRAFYIMVFGFYNCSTYSLLNQIVLRITGLDNSTAAFGFVVLVKGTAGFFSPPLADAIANAAQDSNAIVFFAGSMYVICMLSIVLLIGKDKK